MRLARIALPRATAISLCACHKCARRVAFRLEPTTTPAQVARRRVDLRLIKEAEARGCSRCPGQYLWKLIRRECER